MTMTRDHGDGIRVSVVIPVRDGARYLRAALDSVRGQTHPPFEIIVVDDGSADGSGEIAALTPGVRVIRLDGRGAAAARNRGLAECRGDVVAFQDADDLWDPDKTAKQLAYLMAHPDVWCTVCHRVDFLDDSVTSRAASWTPPGLLDVPQPSFSTGVIVCWRKLFDVVGGFDPAFVIAHDFDWFARVRAAGHRIGVLDEVLYRRRIHDRNLCADQPRLHLETARACHAHGRRQQITAAADVRVAVVMPARNAAATIDEALDSAMAQTLPPAEIVVVDDGSTDETRAIVAARAPAVRLLTQPASGVAAARNYGVSVVTAPWIAFLDADDRWPVDSLARLAAIARRRGPDAVDIVEGHLMNVPQARWAAVVAGGDVSGLQVFPGIGTGTLIARSLWPRVGAFDAGYTLGETVDWRMRARDAGARVERIADVVLWRRVHGANTVLTQRHASLDYLRIVRAAIQRRRESGAADAQPDRA